VDYFHDAQHTYCVTEDCPGGELFALVTAHPQNFGEAAVQGCMSQILQGVHYLHTHNIAHRDLSLENVLVQGLNPFVCKVMDFGQAVLCRASDGRAFRYFGNVGKAYYKAPESHIQIDKVTREPVMRIDLPARPAGDAGSVVQVVHGQGNIEILLPSSPEGAPCTVETAGYSAEAFDTFSCGGIFFILAFKAPPWTQTWEQDRGFQYVRKAGVARLAQAWGKPLLSNDAMQLMQALLSVDPQRRLTIHNALSSPWMAAVAAPPPPIPAVPRPIQAPPRPGPNAGYPGGEANVGGAASGSGAAIGAPAAAPPQGQVARGQTAPVRVEPRAAAPFSTNAQGGVTTAAAISSASGAVAASRGGIGASAAGSRYASGGGHGAASSDQRPTSPS